MHLYYEAFGEKKRLVDWAKEAGISYSTLRRRLKQEDLTPEQFLNRAPILKKNNTSGYQGVCWHKSHKKWIAHKEIAGKAVHLGYFATPEEASKAYQECVNVLRAIT